MATKKICDRCGAEINPRESMTWIEICDSHYERKSEAELCVSCAFHLSEWLKGEGEKE